MMILWKLIIGGLWKPLAWLLGAVGLYTKGRADAANKAKLRNLEAAQKTNERIDNADLGIGANDADNIEWLRKRAERDGNT